MVTPEEILGYWLDEIDQKNWYIGSDELDQTIRDRFEETWENVCKGAGSLWLTYPSGTLAYVILTDQLSRNMFRGSAKAFASDGIARAAAKMAIDREWDKRIDEPARQFFYTPLMHSECLADQDRCVRLTMTRMDGDGTDILIHPRAHREIIRQFGRFPYRNDALGRVSRPDEAAFIESGGYGAMLRKLQDQTQAA